ncbi:imidazolonepropionase [Oscillochloris sp. ZM17-4]|uniref:imidazolonepropionase n=1 Tax=Oscillochloris sp. ZM17-4 TaxID=2866714 RepID=UPI001C736DD8|nr:imidazolonepropionase [Oscillochloris sp. ZM17-4]MBX0326358.1 imidazolonepropionase [Oscillochloris sp. ZM17-4]
MHIDLLIHSASQVVTCAGPPGPRRGPAMADVGAIPGGAVAVHQGTIIAVGASDELRAAYTADREIDAAGRAVCPGFVDPHTHLVYAGDRVGEFEWRIAGASYLEIQAAGGGIVATMRATRAAGVERLVAESLPRLRQMLALGTTTAEVKTGYGLSLDAELRQLEAIAALDAAQPIRLVPTFLPAHALPPEYAGRPDAYIDLVIREMLPAAARWHAASAFDGAGVPLFIDVFCERGAFDVAQSRRVLEAGRALDMGVKAHVDEFTALGGLELALELGAVSVDHLDVTGPAGIALLADSTAVAVVIPAVTFNLGGSHYADARAMIDAGAAVALTTDINPGSAPCPSMPLVMAIACRYQRLLPAEALLAATVNAAHAIGVGNRVGSLELGKAADILILDAADYRHLAYEFGGNLISQVIKQGVIL